MGICAGLWLNSGRREVASGNRTVEAYTLV
jgi:hypothetical protein